jgi:hypothetical protein
MDFDFAPQNDLGYDNDIARLLFLSNCDDSQSAGQQIMPMPVGLPYSEPNSDTDLAAWAVSFMDSIGMEGHVSCYSTGHKPHGLTLVKLEGMESRSNSNIQTSNFNVDNAIRAALPDDNTANGDANTEVEHNISISGLPQKAERADLRSLSVRVFVAPPIKLPAENQFVADHRESRVSVSRRCRHVQSSTSTEEWMSDVSRQTYPTQSRWPQ